MDHVVVPLDGDHRVAVIALATALAEVTGIALPGESFQPHVTLVAFAGIDRKAAAAAITDVARTASPVMFHAHGYGFFTGDVSSQLSLHVPVVRGDELDRLHRTIYAALRDAGAEIAGWCEPELWSPHITLLDRGLDATSLGVAVAWLSRRHHPSWQIPVRRLEVTGGWNELADTLAVTFGPALT